MRDYAYYETGKPFAPQPGVIYRNENGEDYICLNYALYVNRWNRADVLPVMQRVTDRPENWTLFAHDIKIYEDGCIAWGFSTGIGFLPREPYDGDMEFVNEKLRKRSVWIVIEYWHDICGKDAFEVVGVYDSEDKARAVQEELINENAHDVIAFDSLPIGVEISECDVTD